MAANFGLGGKGDLPAASKEQGVKREKEKKHSQLTRSTI
jgi:hypothetical protein